VALFGCQSGNACNVWFEAASSHRLWLLSGKFIGAVGSAVVVVVIIIFIIVIIVIIIM
jgi:hypothetical protein